MKDMPCPQRRFIPAFLASAITLLCPAAYGQTQNTNPPQAGPSPVKEDQRGKLIRGKPIEQELKGGESDVYTIKLKKGKFLHVEVQQHGMKVIVSLNDPERKTIGESDSPTGSFGPEFLSVITASSGEHRLCVRPEDSTSGAAKYQITLTELRAPQALDHTRVSAERTLTEVTHLWDEGSAESLRKAGDKLNEALSLWQALGDSYEQGLTLNVLGQVSFVLGDRRKALEYFDRALPLRRAASDHDGEAVTLNNLGSTYDSLGEKRKALECFQQALSLERVVGDPVEEASSLDGTGRVYLSLGDYQKGLDFLKQSLPLRRTSGDRRGEANTLSAMGVVYANLGEKRPAVESYRLALALQRATGDHAGEAATLTFIAAVDHDSGQEQEALDLYSQALALERDTGDRVAEGMTLNLLGAVYLALGERQKVIDCLEQSLQIQRATGDRRGETMVLQNLGLITSNLGDQQKALDYYGQALQMERTMEDRTLQAGTLSNIGSTYSLLGEQRKALDYFAMALPLRREVGDREGEAITLSNIGRAHEKLGEQQESLDAYDEALAIIRAVQHPLYESVILFNLMNYWKALGRPSLAILLGKEGIDRLQEVRRNIKNLPAEDRQSFLKSKEEEYRTLGELLIQTGRFAEAQQVLDLLKVEEYSEYGHHRGSSDSADKPVTLTHNEEASKEAGEPIQAELTAIGQQWFELNRKTRRNPDEQARFDDLSEKLNAANQQLQNYFKQLYEDFGRGEDANRAVDEAKGQSSSLQNILRERGVKPGTVGIYTLVLNEKSIILVITPSVMVARDVLISRADLHTKVFAFLRAVQSRAPEQDLLSKAHELYKILFGPIEKDLQGARATTLVWSLDDVLRYLPLAALHDGKQYLAERFANVVLTTTSIGNLKDQPHIPSWRGLAMGVSKDYEGLGELAAVPGELNAVITSTALKGSHGPVPGTIMLDDSFTEKSMESALDQPPPLIHIATHFVFNAGDDEKSYLLLSGKDEGGKGYHLSLADLRDDPRINFSGVELLTLSGCQTATESKDSDGREVDSLGIIGQRKGAKAVVATLWKVEDNSVAVLMETFYRLWTTTPGMTKSEALRQAQLALLHGASNVAFRPSHAGNDASRYSDPFYWAPFILIGNWK
jgi:CHAT domain-containing protein/Tfp pilus assembly protein PilF